MAMMAQDRGMVQACHQRCCLRLTWEIYYLLVDTYGDEHVDLWLDFDPQKYDDILVYLEDKLLVGAK